MTGLHVLFHQQLALVPTRVRSREMRFIALCLFAFISSPVAAQRGSAIPGKSAPLRSGVVEGDVYLVTKGGDVKKGAANEVVLLRVPTNLGDPFAALCRVQLDRSCRLYAADTLARSQMPLGDAQLRMYDLTMAHIRENAKN